MLLDQLVDGRGLKRNQLRAAAGGRVLDVGRRMSDAIEEAVGLVVAECRAMLVGLQFGSEREVLECPAHGAQQLFHRVAGARTGVADVEALALEVGELGDTGILAGQQDRKGVVEGKSESVRVDLGGRRIIKKKKNIKKCI